MTSGPVQRKRLLGYFDTQRDNLSRFRLFTLALGIGAVLELLALNFALQASDVLYGVSHWIIYDSVNFAEVTDLGLENKAHQNQVLSMLFTYLYFSAGLIIPFAIIRWARFRVRLMTAFLIVLALIVMRFQLVGSVFG